MILFSHKFGQLGNRLFAFAHLIANAAANNTTIVNLSFDEYANFFRGSQGTICRYPSNKGLIKSRRLRTILFLFNKGTLKFLRTFKLLKSPIHIVVIADLPEYKLGDSKFFELDSVHFQRLVKKKPIVLLFGRFFRDYSNFKKYQHVIRDYFTPNDIIQSHVHQFIKACRENSDLLIGVHIRRGDYAQFMKGKYFYTQDQYADKMIELTKKTPEKKITYVICSNEAIDPQLFQNINFVVSKGTPVEDMYSLAQCDFIMGPPSTFSSWASFYGDKPLYYIQDINQPVSLQSFIQLPPSSLYNF